MDTENTLSEAKYRSAEKYAILSACWGSLAPIMVADSAIIILFASMLGADDMLSMVTTSLNSLAKCFLLLPFAVLASKYGYKRVIINATLASSFMILLVAAAPWFGTGWSKSVLLISLALFSIMMTLYVSAWFPLLSGFLNAGNRGRFFGKMRFSWQLTTMIFFFVCGLIIGKNPSIWLLQILIVVTGVCMLGRAWYIRFLPTPKDDASSNLKFNEGVSDALNNKPLCGFSVYICCLYLAAYATLPLTYVYLKHLKVPDNIVVIISSIALGGTMTGFLFAGRLVDTYGVKKLLLFIHFSFAAINLCLFFINTGSMILLIIIGVLASIYGFFLACSSVAISSEMMAMASPNNRAVSMAFCGTFYAAGMGGSRLLTSLVLGSGMLASKWHIGSMQINHYQTLFLLFGCAITFVCLMLVLVPAIFPKSNYTYLPH